MVGAELIDTGRESQLWGQTYDHKIEESLAIPEAISGKIPDYLHLRWRGGKLPSARPKIATHTTSI